MNRTAVFFALAFLTFMPLAAARAQIPPPPTPAPDPHLYTDPGMQFVAPADAVLAGRRIVSVDQLTSELQPVAVWVLHPGKDDMRTITIAMETFEGAPEQWEGQFESQMHSSGGSGLLIRHKTPMSLLNGMPANFVEVTSGSGFTTTKQFAVVWADGQRGIVLSETGRLGDISAEEAQTVLKNASATRYPIEQP